eukprot:11627695-Alexandrium_andersonii.AAC.1
MSVIACMTTVAIRYLGHHCTCTKLRVLADDLLLTTGQETQELPPPAVMEVHLEAVVACFK